jgi:hypothetical protein
MSLKFTQPVSPSLCIGDSLSIFNNNFRVLDENIANLPRAGSSATVRANIETTEQGANILRFSTKNNQTETFDKFDTHLNNSKQQFVYLDQQGKVSVNVTAFPAPSSALDIKPTGIASFLARGEGSPKMTLYWTSSSTQNAYNDFLYSTNNSAVTVPLSDSGLIQFKPNAPVSCILPTAGQTVYIGGEFTAVDITTKFKFCALNLSQGTKDSSLLRKGNIGAVVPSDYDLNSTATNFGTKGEILSIAEHNNRFLILGGSFNAPSKGRGLTIIDKQTSITYPFYVNGIVREVKVYRDELYVVGKFDYINFGDASLPKITGARVACNGLARIKLNLLQDFAGLSIDVQFSQFYLEYFTELQNSINCIEFKGDVIIIGGLFDVYENNKITAKNLLFMDKLGKILPFMCLVEGEVLKFCNDNANNKLYVVGDVTSFCSTVNFYASPRIFSDLNNVFHAFALDVTVPTNPIFDSTWKPRFNGTVTDIVVHDNYFDSYVYCVGNFTKVNSLTVGYIAALKKSHDNNEVGLAVTEWRMFLNQPPNRYGKALGVWTNPNSLSETSLLVAGQFHKINNQPRPNLARLARVGEAITYTNIPNERIEWEVSFDCVTSGGAIFLQDNPNTASTADYPGNFGHLHQTELSLPPRTFVRPGDFINLQLKRKFNSYGGPVYILGWKIDYV